MFIQDLWDSVFQPGTPPALVQATHASFALLLATLAWMVYHTGSIHFINLFVISAALWAAVTWFLSELAKAKLKSNEELAEQDEKDAKDGKDKKEPKKDI